MATLTLENVPDDLHRRLRERAERNRRSVGREAIQLLEQAVGASAEPERDEAWDQVTAFRKKLAAEGVWITADEVRAAVDEGRP